jgi:hypothetical protein
MKTRPAAFCRPCTLEKLERHPENWRGNTTRHKKGYVMVYAPGHPNSSGGYVFEHRLVMEDHVGRYLLPNENVHHLNGKKDDNRLDNLELWVRTQPAGQRATDLVDWAYEIISMYGGLVSNSNKLQIT